MYQHYLVSCLFRASCNFVLCCCMVDKSPSNAQSSYRILNACSAAALFRSSSDNLGFTITGTFSLYSYLSALCQSCLHVKYHVFFAARKRLLHLSVNVSTMHQIRVFFSFGSAASGRASLEWFWTWTAARNQLYFSACAGTRPLV